MKEMERTITPMGREPRLREKVVVVTGGAGGIGRTYCTHLAREGAAVVIADIDGESAGALAERLCEEFGPKQAAAVQFNVTSETEVERLASETVDRFGAIDVLVNNIGTYPHQEFEDITFEDWRRVLSLNLDSVFLCSRAVLPMMKAQGAGKIVNVATNLVWIGLAGMVHYVTAKTGVVGFTRALSREVGSWGITVNAIAPGAVAPPVHLLDNASLERLEQIVTHQAVKWCERPIDLVGALLFLASSDSDFVSGQVLTVDGGLTTH
ncbi:MAG: SDR family oxidoreductase [Actinomycetota bacterium]|nr:SDR family oxidoreductase [Actinomycetota bacterium]